MTDFSSEPIRVRAWVRGSDEALRSGLSGFVSRVYGDLVLDGLTRSQGHRLGEAATEVGQVD